MAASNEAGGKAPSPLSGGMIPRLVFASVLIALLVGGVGYWLSVRGTESTDDAFTDGRLVMIAPKLAGYVTVLNVTDNSRVTAGQVLLEIDPRDVDTARDKAAAAVGIVQAELDTARANLAIAQVKYPSDLASARAAVEAAQAELVKARSDRDRQRKVDIRATTEQQIDASVAGERAAQAQLAETEAHLTAAELVPQNIAVAEAQVRQLDSQLAQAKADLAQAQINLGYTRLVAPFDGWVTKRNVELGSFVEAGQSLFSLVSSDVWVTANFKESQLAAMHPGQTATIEVDAYPGLKVTGHVDSIQMGSGSRFTAFPAENATGNFVKIVQRVPVKIVIDGGMDADHPLPLGLSVEPVVRVK